MKEYFSVAEILAVAAGSLPADRRNLNRFIEERGWRNDAQRARKVDGNGRDGQTWEYHFSILPAEVQVKLLAERVPDQQATARANDLWRRFDAMPDSRKEEAKRRLARVSDVNNLSQCMSKQAAVAFVAKEAGISPSTLWSWIKIAADVPRTDRLPALAPRHAGRTVTSECDPRAWTFMVADYMRPEQPSFIACYRRLIESAALPTHQWAPIPSAKTLQRRIEKDVPRGARVLARKGADAAKAVFPHQTRDRGVFAAMQAINADGHRFDVFAKWPDGSIARPVMIAIQDIYSGMFLAHSIDETENKGGVRKALADMIESFGIPEHAYFDNGRQFASKWITGGTPNRFRFKVRDDEPTGILVSLGVKIHWATPYHGQAKPIERAFRDLCEEIAKHPKCAGAYTGNKPHAKPDNYGSKAIPIEDFRLLVAAEMARHNARVGRRSAAANGRSLAETFRASFEASDTLVRRASEEQRRLFLTPAEGVTARKPTGEIQLAGNRYWSEAMVDLAGQKLVVRFEPSNLLLPVAIYSRDGRFICEAECIAATGFNDIEAARTHARKKTQWLKAQREMLALERTLTISDLADMLPAQDPIELPRPNVIQIVPTRGRAAAAAMPSENVWAGAESFGRAVQMMEAQKADVLPLRRKEEGGLG